MAVPQQKIREIVFQLLFSYDMADPDCKDMEALLMKELSVTRKTMREAQEKVEKILSKIDEIDMMIASTAVSYEFERIQRVEKNILRLGVYELFSDDTIPRKVAISEAMRLARKFSTKEAASFVNALLDTLNKKDEGEQEVDVDGLAQSFDQMMESEEVSNEAAQSSAEQEKCQDESEDSGECPS